MTNDDIITVRTFIDANAPSIVKDAFEIICKGAVEALKPSHNNAMVPCPWHDTTIGNCHLLFKRSCGDKPCLFTWTRTSSTSPF